LQNKQKHVSINTVLSNIKRSKNKQHMQLVERYPEVELEPLTGRQLQQFNELATERVEAPT